MARCWRSGGLATWNDNANGTDSGQVRILGWDEADSNFEQLGQSLYGKVTKDHFATSVELSSDGKTLAIGANQYVTGKPGYAEVYRWDEVALAYRKLGKSIKAKDPDGWFGYAVALSGDGKVLVAVGAPYNDENGADSGEVNISGNKL